MIAHISVSRGPVPSFAHLGASLQERLAPRWRSCRRAPQTARRRVPASLSLTESQLETYAFRTVLRAIGNSEPLRQRVLDAHSAKLRQVRERASE